MNVKRHRFLCAFLALAVFVSALFPVSVSAQEPEQTAAETLTAEDAQQMQQTDQAVAALTGSDEYRALLPDERRAAALEQLSALSDEGLV